MKKLLLAISFVFAFTLATNAQAKKATAAGIPKINAMCSIIRKVFARNASLRAYASSIGSGVFVIEYTGQKTTLPLNFGRERIHTFGACRIGEIHIYFKSDSFISSNLSKCNPLLGNNKSQRTSTK